MVSLSLLLAMEKPPVTVANWLTVAVTVPAKTGGFSGPEFDGDGFTTWQRDGFVNRCTSGVDAGGKITRQCQSIDADD